MKLMVPGYSRLPHLIGIEYPAEEKLFNLKTFNRYNKLPLIINKYKN